MQEFDLLLNDKPEELKLEGVKKTFFCNDATFDEYKNRLSDKSIRQLASSVEHVLISNGEPKLPGGIPHYSHQNILLPLDLKMRVFLRHVKSVRVGPLPQGVLDELPDLMPDLLYFRAVPDLYAFKSKCLNFKFVSRFKGLKGLMVEKERLPFNLLTKIINNCQYLEQVSIFEQLKLMVFFERITETQFSFSVPKNKTLLMSSWTEILDHLKNGYYF